MLLLIDRKLEQPVYKQTDKYISDSGKKKIYMILSFTLFSTLDPGAIQKACTYRNRKGDKTQPQWLSAPGGQKYYGSYNVCPGRHT